MCLEISDEQVKEAVGVNDAPGRISEVEKWRLFAEILNAGSALRVKVTGMSMVPFLRGGEILTLKKVDGSMLRRGDLILFRNTVGDSILHRIVRVTRRENGLISFQTKGDALNAFDEPVYENEILGKVCRIEKGVKSIDMETAIQGRINGLIAIAGLFKARLSSVLQGFKNLV